MMQDDGEHNARTDARDPVLKKDRVGGKRKQMMKALPDNRGSDQPEHDTYLANGGEPYDTYRCPEHLYPLMLVAKLHEEAEEIREDMRNPDEYADIIIVAYALARLNNVGLDAIEAAISRRLDMKGTFSLGKVMRREA